MAEQRQLSIRLDPALYESLAFVSKTLRMTVTAFVREAIAEQVALQSTQLVDELSPRLQKLRRYAADPLALAAELDAVEMAEMKHGSDDPAEGVRVDLDEG